MHATLASAFVLLLLAGCASQGGRDEAATSRAAGSAASDRLLLRTAEQSVAVDDVAAAVGAASALAVDLGGHVTSSSVRGEEHARLELRIPAARLEDALDRLAALGEEKARSVSASDVTDEVSDLEATLANQRALRDRLRALLARAEKVEEVLQVERELTRLQTEIDRGQARLERLRSGVALAALALDLERRRPSRILGPLGYLWVGTKWVVTKLFVIRE
jgi:hypothetical protein